MRWILFKTLLLAFAYLFSASAIGAELANVCPIKKKITTPTAFLVDKNNNVVQGPVDFGTYVTREDFVTDYMVKSTDYRLVLFPARLSVKSDECNFCLSVKKTKPLCQDSTTYDVGVGMVFRGRPGAVSPYKVDAAFALQFNDPKLDEDPTVSVPFDARITGVLVKMK
jgi:hypothetical protein